MRQCASSTYAQWPASFNANAHAATTGSAGRASDSTDPATGTYCPLWSVSARDRAQPPRDRYARRTQRFEVAAEALDVGPARSEQRDVMFCAPRGPLA